MINPGAPDVKRDVREDRPVWQGIAAEDRVSKRQGATGRTAGTRDKPLDMRAKWSYDQRNGLAANYDIRNLIQPGLHPQPQNGRAVSLREKREKPVVPVWPCGGIESSNGRME